MIRDHVPTPDTRIVRTDLDLVPLLDGNDVPGFKDFVEELRMAAAGLSYPVFLRTGQTSGKHKWDDTCCVRRPTDFEQHVVALLEYSHIVTLIGLPTDVWCVRKMLDVKPMATAACYRNMPLVPEMRFFSNGSTITHEQPYWPWPVLKSAGIAKPRSMHRELVGGFLEDAETMSMARGYATAAARAVNGPDQTEWSVDILRDRNGLLWVTDMALGNSSYRYDPNNQEEENL